MQRSCKRGLCIFYLTFPGLSGILCKIPNDESEKPQCIYFKIQPVCGRLSKDRMGDETSLQTMLMCGKVTHKNLIDSLHYSEKLTKKKQN